MHWLILLFSSLASMMHLPMLSHTWSVMFPGVMRCFGSRNIIHTHPGEPAGADQTPTCVWVAPLHGSLLFGHSHLEAFSAASVLCLMAFCGPPRCPGEGEESASGPETLRSQLQKAGSTSSTRSASLARFLPCRLLHPVLPGDCKLQNDHLPGCCWQEHHCLASVRLVCYWQ